MLGIGVGASAIALFRLSANQTTTIANNDRIIFDRIDTQSGWITLSNGRITINGPGRYFCQFWGATTGTTANIVGQWYDFTSSVYIGKKMAFCSSAASGANASVGRLVMPKSS